MKAPSKIIGTAVTAAVVGVVTILLLTGCGIENTAAVVNGSTITPSPASKAVVENTPATAQKNSGLAPPAYADATAQAKVLTSNPMVKANVDTLAAKYGKPVVILVHYVCTGGQRLGWGIAGALYGSSNDLCGTGTWATEATAMAEVNRRAAINENWTSADYILLFADRTH
jgi:hypothetical protein